MKKVFSSHSEVTHVFMQRKQNEGRAGNIFFENDTLYSYGRHFELAKFVESPKGLVLVLNSANYSVSTAKHQGAARRAVNRNLEGLKAVLSFEFSGDRFSMAYQKTYFENQINRLIEVCRKSKKLEYFQRLISLQGDLDIFLHWFYPDQKAENLPIELITKYSTLREKYETQARKAKETRKDKEAELFGLSEEEKQAKKAEKISHWLNGGKVDISMYSIDTLIRANKEKTEVQTSRGAIVPYQAAKLLLHAIRSGREVVGQRIGHFTVNEVTLDNIVIGCHTLNWSVINQFAEVEQW